MTYLLLVEDEVVLETCNELIMRERQRGEPYVTTVTRISSKDLPRILQPVYPSTIKDFIVDTIIVHALKQYLTAWKDNAFKVYKPPVDTFCFQVRKERHTTVKSHPVLRRRRNGRRLDTSSHM